VPALRFTLLPELRDQEPGNAAPLYRKALELLDRLLQEEEKRSHADILFESWLTLPLPDLPHGAVQSNPQLGRYKEVLDLLDRAARCERCDWRQDEGFRQNGSLFGITVDGVLLHLAGRLLGVRARLELARDRPDKALRTLRSAYVCACRLFTSYPATRPCCGRRATRSISRIAFPTR
jgi:hypothetical protein